MIKKAITKYAVHDIIKNRWSPRSFSEKAIPQETLLSLFEAASWASSSRNEQPWRFICGVKGENENYDKIFNTLTEGNQRWTAKAPVLAIGLSKTNFNSNGKPNRHCAFDLGQAVALLAIQAGICGLYIHPMGGFVIEKVKEIFNIDDSYEPMVAISIGYLGASEDLPDDLRMQEEEPRSRRSLDKTLFFNDFDV